MGYHTVSNNLKLARRLGLSLPWAFRYSPTKQESTTRINFYTSSGWAKLLPLNNYRTGQGSLWLPLPRAIHYSPANSTTRINYSSSSGWVTQLPQNNSNRPGAKNFPCQRLSTTVLQNLSKSIHKAHRSSCGMGALPPKQHKTNQV